MTARRDRVEFSSFDGAKTVRVGQGQRCVLLEVVDPAARSYVLGVVLTDDEAEALGRSLVRRARYSRRPG